MCHEWWTRQEMRRAERFDDELRYLLDEEERRAAAPIVEHEREEEPADPERPVVEAATPS
jgi:hypothetical protein